MAYAALAIASLALFLACTTTFTTRRMKAVDSFRSRLWKEELNWQEANRGDCTLESRRFDTLPSRNKMFLCFWYPLSCYAKKLKPIAEYYKHEGYRPATPERPS